MENPATTLDSKPAAPVGDDLLVVTNLQTHFKTSAGLVRAVDGVSFSIPRGKTLAVVGESGCGKSVTALSIMQLVPRPVGFIAGGSIHFAGRELTGLAEREKRAFRGKDISMIFQEPMTCMNPVMRVGDQIDEAVREHENVSATEARARSIHMLRAMGLPDPERQHRSYPHELSGGMKQRAMIAMGLICNPQLLIADEPTTALDVTIQAQILDLLRNLQETNGMSILFITHDLGVVAEMAHRVCVMYAGHVVEQSDTEPLFAEPLHPYTIGLFNSLPQMGGKQKRLHTIPGSVPSPTNFPKGCPFHPRCERATDECRATFPGLEEKKAGRWCACHDVPREEST